MLESGRHEDRNRPLVRRIDAGDQRSQPTRAQSPPADRFDGIGRHTAASRRWGHPVADEGCPSVLIDVRQTDLADHQVVTMAGHGQVDRQQALPALWLAGDPSPSQLEIGALGNGGEASDLRIGPSLRQGLGVIGLPATETDPSAGLGNAGEQVSARWTEPRRRWRRAPR